VQQIIDGGGNHACSGGRYFDGATFAGGNYHAHGASPLDTGFSRPAQLLPAGTTGPMPPDSLSGWNHVATLPTLWHTDIRSHAGQTDSAFFYDIGADGLSASVVIVDLPGAEVGTTVVLNGTLGFDPTLTVEASAGGFASAGFDLQIQEVGGSLLKQHTGQIDVFSNGNHILSDDLPEEDVTCTENGVVQCVVDHSVIWGTEVPVNTPILITASAFTIGSGPVDSSIDALSDSSFTVSLTPDNDLATFVVVPEPAAMTLLAMGATILARRRSGLPST
jgi:hypothetical protein